MVFSRPGYFPHMHVLMFLCWVAEGNPLWISRSMNSSQCDLPRFPAPSCPCRVFTGFPGSSQSSCHGLAELRPPRAHLVCFLSLEITVLSWLMLSVLSKNHCFIYFCFVLTVFLWRRVNRGFVTPFCYLSWKWKFLWFSGFCNFRMEFCNWGLRKSFEINAHPQNWVHCQGDVDADGICQIVQLLGGNFSLLLLEKELLSHVWLWVCLPAAGCTSSLLKPCLWETFDGAESSDTLVLILAQFKSTRHDALCPIFITIFQNSCFFALKCLDFPHTVNWDKSNSLCLRCQIMILTSLCGTPLIFPGSLPHYTLSTKLC